MRISASVLVLALTATIVRGQQALSSFVRMRGQGESVIQGLGLVTGLNGTGDSGADLVMARPLAEALRRMGNPLASFEDLRNTNSAALVLVSCTIPPTGAAADDRYDVRVSVLHSATSLAGGELFIAPMLGPNPQDATVYAFAQGPIVLQDAELPRTGIVRGGARMVEDIDTTPEVGAFFDLVVQPGYVGWPAVNYLANQIEDEYYLTVEPSADPVAVVLDERTIRVIVPEAERPNVPAFVGQILQTSVQPALLGLPARVVADSRSGLIVVDGEVEISPSIITHKDLVIQTTVPPPEPTPEAPIVRRGRWTGLQTGSDAPTLARLRDLLDSFDQLDIPPAEQIAILVQVHKAGNLHGRLIVDGVEQ